MGINISSLPVVDTQVTSNSLDSCDPTDCSPQAPLSLRFPRQGYWSGLRFLLQEDLPDPGIKPASPALAGRFLTTEPPGKPSAFTTKRNTLNQSLWSYQDFTAIPILDLYLICLASSAGLLSRMPTPAVTLLSLMTVSPFHEY